MEHYSSVKDQNCIECDQKNKSGVSYILDMSFFDEIKYAKESKIEKQSTQSRYRPK